MTTWTYNYSDELYHYGVKGMKWGVRHDKDKSTNTRSKRTDTYIRTEKSKNQNGEDETKRKNKEIAKKVLIGIGAVSAAALIGYGVYKVKKNMPSSVIAKNPTESVSSILEKIKSDGLFGNPMVFDNDSDQVKHYSKNLFDKNLWENALSEAERTAVTEYTDFEYNDMNRLLRFGKEKCPNVDRTNSYIKSCTDALEKSRLSEDVLVHRHVAGVKDFASMLGMEPEALRHGNIKDSLKGTRFTDKGFFSAHGLESESGDFNIHVFVKKGSKGMYVDPISIHPGEHEFLLQRNSTFEIIDYITNEFGTLTDCLVSLVEQKLND